nr:P-loop NTPase [bacterium]
MGTRLVIASGKGGTGKTMMCANLGAALAMYGKRVAVMDGDMGLRNLDMALGMESRIVFDLADVADGRCGIEQTLVRHSRIQTLYLMPAPQNRLPADVPEETLMRVSEKLAGLFDYVLIDSPAGIGRGFTMCAQAADGLIAVTLPEAAALRDCDRMLRMAGPQYGARVWTVLNRVQKRAMRSGLQESMESVLMTLDSPPDLIVPEDIRLAQAVDGMPASVRRHSPGGAIIRKFAVKLIREGAAT